MKTLLNFISISCLFVGSAMADAFPDNLAEMVKERAKVIVGIDFVVERELDRQTGSAYGIVIDETGTVVVLTEKIPSWLPFDKLKDFKGESLPSSGDKYDLDYIGRDYLSGWHVLKFRDGLPETFRSITEFESSIAEMGDATFGVGGLDKDSGYDLFMLTSRVAMSKDVPDRQVFYRDDIAPPGCPVFNAKGAFVGWTLESFGFQRVMNVGRDNLNVTIRNPDESSVMLSSEVFLAYVEHILETDVNAARPWVGIAGMQPIDPDVAKFMGLENRSGIVLSEILEEGPSAQSGVENNDIVIAVDGKDLRVFKPDFYVTNYFQKLIRQKNVGETFSLTVIRGTEELTVDIEIAAGPKNTTEADYKFFDRLGFTVREFLRYDAVSRRLRKDEMGGAIVGFVKPSSAIATADLRVGDWIKQVDGKEVFDFEEVLAALNTLEESEQTSEYVLLVERNNETAFIRAKLN